MKASYLESRRAWRIKNAEFLLEYHRKYVEANRKKITEYKKAWAFRNKDKIKALQHAKYVRHLEEIRAATKICAQSNPERTRAYKRKWDKLNPGKANAKTARRYATKIHATPAWANVDAMMIVYIKAASLTRETGIPHQVDHIIPLRGETVSGLHWEGNLQVLPRLENIRKSNRFLEGELNG